MVPPLPAGLAVEAGLGIGHGRTRVAKMNSLAGILVSLDSFSAVCGDGMLTLRRMRETCERDRPSIFAATSASVRCLASIHS